MKSIITVFIVFIFSTVTTLAQAPQDPGELLYDQHCASCHDNPEETKSPSVESLRQMAPRPISYALTHGKMRVQAAALSDSEVDLLVGYLAAAKEADVSWVETNRCTKDRATPDTSGEPTVPGVGFGLQNHRNMSAEQAGLSKSDMPKLKLAWSMAFPQTVGMRSQPVIIGNTMYLAVVDNGQLFAINIPKINAKNGGSEKPCVQWFYQHQMPLRTSLHTGKLKDGRTVLVFGDNAAHIQMVDAAKGELIWRTSVRISSVSNTTAMPTLYNGVVYAPISSGELNMGAAPDYECCTSHGGVVALNAENGEIKWIYRTMAEATPRGKSRIGTQLWGPSGAPIWTTPAIDEKRGVLYVGTGQNTSAPATDTSDAVLAINLEDGSLRWKFQATANDIFLTGCLFERDGPNCPGADSVMADWDFGAGMIIAQRADGSDIILAGQKSGTLWALDPDNNGELIWKTDVGPGGPVGGIHWGMAYDGRRVFAAVNQIGIAGEDPNRETNLSAIDVETGEILWQFEGQADCTGDRKTRMTGCDRNYGLSAATLLMDGAVIQGSNDGFLRIFSADDGKQLFNYDTAKEFSADNGVTGHGGSIDNASIVAANGLLLVQSGYGIGGVAGNVLLAFAPE